MLSVGDFVRTKGSCHISSWMVGKITDRNGYFEVFFEHWTGGHGGTHSTGRGYYNIYEDELEKITPEEYKKGLKRQKEAFSPSFCSTHSIKKSKKKGLLYCEKCLNSSHDVYGLRRNIKYSKVESVRRGKVAKYDRYVGVEIEAESKSTTKMDELLDIPKEVNIGGDPTLSRGVEVRTPPRKKQVFETMIHRTCKAMKKAGYTTNSHCGLHIHLDFSEQAASSDWHSLLNLYETYYAVESVLYYSLPVTRRTKPYSAFVSPNKSFFAPRNDVERHISTSVVRNIWDETRYEVSYGRAAFNVNSLSEHGSIEIRSHEGTIDDTEIINWSGVLLSLFEYAIHKFDREAVLHLLSYAPGSKEKRFATYELLDLQPELREYLEARTKSHTASKKEPFISYSERSGEIKTGIVKRVELLRENLPF